MTLFKVFAGLPEQVERQLNDWAESLPKGTRIRRTQLAAAPPLPAAFLRMEARATATVIALVNYDPPEHGPGNA